MRWRINSSVVEGWGRVLLHCAIWERGALWSFGRKHHTPWDLVCRLLDRGEVSIDSY